MLRDIQAFDEAGHDAAADAVTGRAVSFVEALRFALSSYSKRPALLSSIILTFVGLGRAGTCRRGQSTLRNRSVGG
jgi:hypothetical protein